MGASRIRSTAISGGLSVRRRWWQSSGPGSICRCPKVRRWRRRTPPRMQHSENLPRSFGRVAEETISKNLNVQPTVRIRPGYKFNVMVDQDIVFPSVYGDR
ncbi:TrbI/VirB10 family protein (plasmid) [Rhizobium beringeri]|nr:TrbI/VirB10 family protein [Rhizobium beringeri]